MIRICSLYSHGEQNEENEALLKKLDELSVVKPVKFNLNDTAELKVTPMCSSSISEEDSGFVSSETAPIKETVSLDHCIFLFCMYKNIH